MSDIYIEKMMWGYYCSIYPRDYGFGRWNKFWRKEEEVFKCPYS